VNDAKARGFLRAVFDAAVASAQPSQVLAAHLPAKPKGRCIVVGAGKASAAMAAALEQAWPDVPLSGVVVTRYGHAVPTSRVRIIEAAHPVPDDNSLQAARDIMDAVRGLTKDDVVIALMSGGGSALLVSPAKGMTLADKQALNRALLRCGASIADMNVVRKQLSLIKGGKLARAAHPAKVVTLVISDVPGDDPAIIASGPTVFDGSTPQDAINILSRYKIDVPHNVMAALRESPDQGAPLRTDVRMIASPLLALKAAAAAAVAQGVTPLILGDALEGEARDVGKVHAGMALSCRLHGHPVKAPCVLLSGGETTVTLTEKTTGRGGRNTEFLLSTAIALNGAENIWGLAADTDGIDGSDSAAGAVMTPDTVARARAQNLDPAAFLNAHDSHGFFSAIGDLVVTGPTFTNVNDMRAILITTTADFS
jgi:glycerate 2-kinase